MTAPKQKTWIWAAVRHAIRGQRRWGMRDHLQEFILHFSCLSHNQSRLHCIVWGLLFPPPLQLSVPGTNHWKKEKPCDWKGELWSRLTFYNELIVFNQPQQEETHTYMELLGCSVCGLPFFSPYECLHIFLWLYLEIKVFIAANPLSTSFPNCFKLLHKQENELCWQ